jgi:hypothetical protein
MQRKLVQKVVFGFTGFLFQVLKIDAPHGGEPLASGLVLEGTNGLGW